MAAADKPPKVGEKDPLGSTRWRRRYSKEEGEIHSGLTGNLDQVQAREYELAQKKLGMATAAPSEILKSIVGADATPDDVEAYYREKLEKAKGGVSDERMLAVFGRLEAELGDAMRELTLAHDELDAVMNTHMCIPGIDDSHAGNLLHDVHAALQDVEELASGHESGELITAYISDRAAKKVRDAAEAGAMQELKKAEAERSKWPKYMVMASWDFTDHRGDSAVHLAARNGRHDALEFLLVRKALPSLVNARGVTALHEAKDFRTAELLLEHGADIIAVDKEHRTAFDCHKAMRMSGRGRDCEGRFVAQAFSKQQQVTGSEAMPLLKERNMSPAERAAREAVRAAERKETQRLESIEAAKGFYDQAIGALFVKDYAKAEQSLADCLEHDRNHPNALLKLADMAAKDQGTAKETIARLAAERDAEEAEAAKQAAAAAPEPEPEPELAPSVPSLGNKPAAVLVDGEGGIVKTRSTLASVESHELSPHLSPRSSAPRYRQLRALETAVVCARTLMCALSTNGRGDAPSTEPRLTSSCCCAGDWRRRHRRARRPPLRRCRRTLHRAP